MRPLVRITSQAGLTLVELVVVLMILVIVAGAAITASGTLVEEANYESSQTTMRTLERAVLGHYDSASSGEDFAVSFVSDIGRLPRVAAGTGDIALAELWEKPFTVAAFEIQSPLGDPEVRLAAGWRGPYVYAGYGAAKLVDGWGRAFALLAADDTTAIATTELRKIRTLGASGLVGGTGYEADETLVFESTLPTTVPARHVGDVLVRVRTTAATGENVYIRIYGPTDGDVVTLGQSVGVPANGTDVVHTFLDIPIGTRVLRAYRSANEPATMESEFDGAAVRSSIRNIEVLQGGIPEVELTLP